MNNRKQLKITVKRSSLTLPPTDMYTDRCCIFFFSFFLFFFACATYSTRKCFTSTSSYAFDHAHANSLLAREEVGRISGTSGRTGNPSSSGSLTTSASLTHCLVHVLVSLVESPSLGYCTRYVREQKDFRSAIALSSMRLIQVEIFQ